MTHTPTISLVVPVYNVETYLSACLDSLLIQTLPGIEIIAVDDGSTDTSSDILASYQRKHAITVIRQENGGLSAARNTGVAHAQGELIMFVDSDDTLLPDACAQVWSAYQQHHPQLVVFGARCILPSEASSWTRDVLSPFDAVYQGFSFDWLTSKRLAPFAWRVAVDRSFLAATGVTFDTNVPFGEDLVWSFDLFPQVTTVVSLSSKLYNYKVARPGSLMDQVATDPAVKIDKHLAIAQRILSSWRQMGLVERYTTELLHWLASFFLLDYLRLSRAAYKELKPRATDLMQTYFSEQDVVSGKLASSLQRQFIAEFFSSETTRLRVPRGLRQARVYGDLYGLAGLPRDTIERARLRRNTKRG